MICLFLQHVLPRHLKPNHFLTHLTRIPFIMYNDISTTKPESMLLVQTIDRQKLSSQDRVKVVAMALGLALAKSLPTLAATTATQAAENYSQDHEPVIRDYAGALNELTPIDARLTQSYASKFYQLIHGVTFQPVGFFEASTANSVAHVLLGSALYFSQEDIQFMEVNREPLLRIAAAASIVLSVAK